MTAASVLAADFDMGLRYDRSRSGHGLEIHRQGDAYIVFFYTYATDNSPEWYFCDGRMINGVLQGDCLQFTAPPDSAPPAVADDSRQLAFTLDYINADQSPACQDGVNRDNARQLAAFTWRADDEFHHWCTEYLPVGTEEPDPYYGGIWYGGDNGGYGCSVAHLSETLSAICYFYDALGNPRWTIGLGSVNEDTLTMLHHRGFCRACDTTPLDSSTGGTLGLTLDSDSEPGSGSDQAMLSLRYPDSPGGEFDRDFTLFRLSDGNPLGAHAVPADPIQTGITVAGWNTDLNTLLERIQTVHPNPFHTISEAEFTTQLDSIRRRLPMLTASQVRFDILMLVSSLSRYGRDGHTSAIPITSPVLPLQFYQFSDGLFIVDALPPHEGLIGLQLTHLGDMPITEATGLITRALSRDNDTTPDWTIPIALLLTDPYPALGLSDNAQTVQLTLMDGSGTEAVHSIDTISIETYNAWQPLGRNLLPSRPVTYLSQLDQDFWFTRLDNNTLLYIQYNVVTAQDDNGQTLQSFVNQLNQSIGNQAPEKVIIDLRHNNGGNNTTYGPLLEFLSQNSVDRPDALFAIIGRQTFSAAMNFIADLEAETGAVFVGEASGGSPFHYGDSLDFFLPNTGILLQVSSRVHPSPIPGDDRLAIPADLPTPLSSTQFFQNLDPALDAIRAR